MWRYVNGKDRHRRSWFHGHDSTLNSTVLHENTVFSWETMAGQRDSCRRLCLLVRGAVQGVGFRPFVFRLATEQHLAGWIQNSPDGVRIEVEGCSEQLDSFLERFKRDGLSLGLIHTVEPTQRASAGCIGFEIPESSRG